MANPSKDEIKRFLDTITIPELVGEYIDVLQTPTQQSENLHAINKLKMYKTPWPGGFTMDFYEKIKHILAPKLCTMFVSCLTCQQILPSRTQECIVLIPKKDRDLTFPQPYHPISLLNTDYKMLTTVLATGLNEVSGRFYSHGSIFVSTK